MSYLKKIKKMHACEQYYMNALVKVKQSVSVACLKFFSHSFPSEVFVLWFIIGKGHCLLQKLIESNFYLLSFLSSITNPTYIYHFLLLVLTLKIIAMVCSRKEFFNFFIQYSSYNWKWQNENQLFIIICMLTIKWN